MNQCCCRAAPRRAAQAFLVEGEKGTVDFVGNRTECALLVMIQKWGEDYRAVRGQEGVARVDEGSGGPVHLLHPGAGAACNGCMLACSFAL